MSRPRGATRWPRSRRRRSLESVSLTATSALLLAGVLLPAPFVVESAGPTFNTVGEHEDKELVHIEGARTYPSEGTLDLTTVYVKGGPAGHVNTTNTLLGWFNPADAVMPRDLVYSPELTNEEVDHSNTAAMETSQEDSVAAALTYLHKPYETALEVHASIPDGPAHGVVEQGDRLLAVDSQPVTDLMQLRERLDRAGAKGAELTLERHGKTVIRHVSLTKSQGTGQWQLGGQVRAGLSL